MLAPKKYKIGTTKSRVETFKIRKRKRHMPIMWIELINILHEKRLYRKLSLEDRDFIMSYAYPNLPPMPKIPLLPYEDTVFEDTKENTKNEESKNNLL